MTIKTKEYRPKCPELLVECLVDPNDMAATTLSPTGITRLAADWLAMREEIQLLRNELARRDL